MIFKRYTSYGEKPIFGIFARQTQIIDNYPLHGHDHIEIEYIIQGYLRNTINGEETLLQEGDFYILGSDDLHSLVSETPYTDLYSLCINIPSISREFAEILVSHEMPVSGTLDKEYRILFEKLMHQMICERETPSEYAEEIQYSCARLIISILYRSRPTVRHGESAADTHMNRALRYLARTYRDRVTLEETAHHIGLSPHYFCTLFKERTGLSFVDYLNILRIRKAQGMLISEPNRNITDIAYEVGFGSYANFYRVFCRVLKVSPGEFRENYLNGEMKS